MPSLHTGWVPISGNTAGIFNPMTEAQNAASLANLRFRIQVVGGTPNLEVRPGVQWSDDGETWTDDPSYFMVGTSPSWTAETWTAVTSDDWDFQSFSTWRDLWSSMPGSPGVTRRLFVRFGVFARAVSTATVVSGEARLIVEQAAVSANTAVGGPLRIMGTDATTTWATWPITAWIPAADVAQVRFTLDLQGLTASIKWREVLIQADDPNDPADWAVVATPKSEVTSSGPGTVWGSVLDTITTPSQRYVCFGIQASKAATGGADFALATATLRVDYRGA